MIMNYLESHLLVSSYVFAFAAASLTHTLFLTLSLSHTLSLTHTHTLSLTHTHSLSLFLQLIYRLAGFHFLSRCAGLLSRLVTVPSVLTLVSTPDTYRQLCRTMACTVTTSRHIIDSLDNIEKAITKSPKTREIEAMINMKSALEKTLVLQGEEQSHLIRVLAAVKPCNLCLEVAVQERLPHTLLLLFPDPREEIGEITSHSVILTPKRPAATLLLGNAARCLMPLADDTGRNAALIYDIHGISNPFSVFVPERSCASLPVSVSFTRTTANEKAVLTSNIHREQQQSFVTYRAPPIAVHSIERLVCAMATCSDIRVRRNISILLAKGCGVSVGVRDHVSKFRGMQIMLELQNQL